MEKDIGIGRIEYAEIHRYYPIKIDSKMVKRDVKESINQYDFVSTEIVKKKLLDEEKKQAEIIENILSEFIRNNKFWTDEEEFDKELRKLDHNFFYNVDSQGEQIIIDVQSKLLNEIERCELQIELDSKEKKRIYGKAFEENYEKIIFIPVKARLYNGNDVWINSMLYIFENNMAILKIDIPLKKVEIDYWVKNDVDLYIEEIQLGRKNGQVIRNLNDLYRYYLVEIKEKLKCNIYKFQEFDSIILSNFEGIPTDSEKISKNFTKDIYKIIFAPVPYAEYDDVFVEAKEYLEKYRWGGHGKITIVKSKGGCISFGDNKSRKILNEKLLAQGIKLDDESFDCIYAKDLAIDLEFALIMVLLKKCNIDLSSELKKGNYKKLEEIREEYLKNTYIICDLQQQCYGSANEQVSMFEKMMIYYLNEEVMERKNDSLDKLIELKISKQRKSIEDFFAIVSVVITGVFGLPAIRETVKVLVDLKLWKTDIPLLTIDNTSVLLWIILVVEIGKRIKKYFEMRNEIDI